RSSEASWSRLAIRFTADYGRRFWRTLVSKTICGAPRGSSRWSTTSRDWRGLRNWDFPFLGNHSTANRVIDMSRVGTMQLTLPARFSLWDCPTRKWVCDKRFTCRFTEHSITRGVCTPSIQAVRLKWRSRFGSAITRTTYLRAV